jgi:SAM-dependent methyltransferase
MQPMALSEEGETRLTETGHRRERSSPKATARMRFELQWESNVGRHTDCLVATQLNLWKGLFPPQLETQIMEKPVGDRTAHTFAPGEMVPAWREDRLFSVRDHQFNRRYMRRGLVQPRAGRFYPKGILEGIDGVSRRDRHPFRVSRVTRDHLLVDFNHPLGDKSLRLGVTIEDIRAHVEANGGRCNKISEMVSAAGPGMQARWHDQRTDFWSDSPFLRPDPRPDADFYAEPRLVDHLDRTAIAQVENLYRRLVPRRAAVLDLMSSWHSHLPVDLEAAHVAGLGMNMEELEANGVLHERLVRDLNRTPELPFADASFDAVVCSVSVEYLIRPFEVFREVARVLRPGGRFIVTFSNRWFPPKVIQLWAGLHEFERPGLVSEYFLESGLFDHLQTWSLRGLPRPEDDKYADRMPFSDPVYAVWAERVGG